VILSDTDLLEYIRSGRLVVEPFAEEMVRENGLDLRLGEQLCVLRLRSRVLDVNADCDLSEYYHCIEARDGSVVLEPGDTVLLHTMEYIRMPNDLMGFVELRSTFARLGFQMPPTIIDAGFEGQLTIEVTAPPFPTKIRVGTRFLHVVFARLTKAVSRPYRGRYQGQRGVTLPKLPVDHYYGFKYPWATGILKGAR